MSSDLGAPQNVENQPTGFNSSVDWQYVPRKFFVHQIPDAELDIIAASASSLHLTLFGVCAGASISLLVAVTTAPSLTPAAFSAYISAAIITGLGGLFFGWRGIAASVYASKKLAELRRGIPSGPDTAQKR